MKTIVSEAGSPGVYEIDLHQVMLTFDSIWHGRIVTPGMMHVDGTVSYPAGVRLTRGDAAEVVRMEDGRIRDRITVVVLDVFPRTRTFTFRSMGPFEVGSDRPATSAPDGSPPSGTGR
jgi:hypothetical protein